MKSNLQNTQRGITLVALIITVIVLLILSTVSIKLIMNGGIIDKAEKGTASYSEEEELEQIKLAVSSAKLAGNGFLTAENLNAELQKVFNNAETVSESSNSFKYKNNKTYTINKDGSVGEYKSVLPANYQEVEYIESTGTQYIDTNYIINENFMYEMKFSIIDERTADRVWPILIGSGGKSDGSDGKGYTFGYNYETKKIKNVVTYIQNDIYEMGFKIGKMVYNGEEISTTTSWNGEPCHSVCIFNWITSDAGLHPYCYSIAKVYSVKVYDGDVLVRNFIPCYSTTTVTDANGVQKPANTKGLYDRVEGKFYTNQGSGADFIAGPNV